MQKIIKEGIWRYSENHFEKIILVEQDWDQFHEEGYDEDPPYLNSEGLVYYLHLGDFYYDEYGSISAKSISKPFLSENEAVLYTLNNLSDLKWNN